MGILVTVFSLLIDRCRYHRERKANPVIFLIVSIGVMFFLGGLIRFIIGPGDQIFFDGTRFVLKGVSSSK